MEEHKQGSINMMNSKLLWHGYRCLYCRLAWSMFPLVVLIFCAYPLLKSKYYALIGELIILISASLCVYNIWFKRPLYLIEVACFRPPNWCRIPMETIMEHSVINGIFTNESLEFQRKILERGTLSEYTAVPNALLYLPPKPTLQAARAEAEMVMFGCVEEVISKANISVKEIGVVVVNCSVFDPVPCLASMVVNRFKMRSNVKSFNLGGMGCSATLVALDVARSALMTAEGESYAILISTENITQNWYLGNCHNMLVSNCLFRMGCSAILLSNKRSDGARAKYRLLHLVRTHKGYEDMAYGVAFQREDEEGKVGVYLSKDITAIASEALKTNIRALGPLVLPYYQQTIYLFFKWLKGKGKGKDSSTSYYVPDFTRVFNHFCIHAGGKAVIDGVQKGLKLPEEAVEPARKVLQRFGNTSSSSTWYQFQLLEWRGKMKRGDKIWQITLGSGFKCNSAVWVVNTHISPSINAWSESQ